jgi:hypothetical protein
MVVKRRILLAIPAALSVSLIAASAPAWGAYNAARPDPLSQSGIVRVQDIAVVRKTGGVGPVVALGWREAANPGQLYMTFSTDGGRSYRRNNGNLRRFPVLGIGARGMSVDVCAGRVWAASILPAPGDARGDSDVLLTSRGVNGGSAGQAFVTNTSYDRTTRNVSMACVGDRLLAVAWVETSNGVTRAKLLLRSTEPLGEKAAVRRTLPLGTAVAKGGISIDASTNAVHTAWTGDTARNLYYKRFLISGGKNPSVTRGSKRRLADGDIRWPQIGVRGNHVVLAHTDEGKVRARMSHDGGATFDAATTLVNTGGEKRPSRAYSADVAANRVVVEVVASRQGQQTPKRIQSQNGGSTWNDRDFGNDGARIGALRKTTGNKSLLVEAWQNNAPGADTLRAQYER